jgi:hypothetical protein
VKTAIGKCLISNAYRTVCSVLAAETNILESRDPNELNNTNNCRLFKNWVYKNNHRNVAQTLLEMECRRQTITFVLEGAYQHTHPALTQAFQRVAQKCPTLLKHLTATEMKDRSEDNDFDVAEILSDKDHLYAEAQVKIKFKREHVLSDPYLSIKHPHRLELKHPFVAHLLDAYRNEYGFSSLTILQHFALVWVKRLKFSPSYVSKPQSRV